MMSIVKRLGHCVSALFVSKYQLQLPDRKVLQAQIAAERQRWKAEQESVASGRATPSTSKNGFRSAIHPSKAWGQSPGLVVQIHRLRG